MKFNYIQPKFIIIHQEKNIKIITGAKIIQEYLNLRHQLKLNLFNNLNVYSRNHVKYIISNKIYHVQQNT